MINAARFSKEGYIYIVFIFWMWFVTHGLVSWRPGPQYVVLGWQRLGLEVFRSSRAVPSKEIKVVFVGTTIPASLSCYKKERLNPQLFNGFHCCHTISLIGTLISVIISTMSPSPQPSRNRHRALGT